MKLIKLTTTVAAMAIAAAFATTSAHAQVAGDVILGFEEPGSGGSSNVYEVDLGSISQFSTSQTFDLSSSDLSTEFGSGWASSSLLQFGLIGDTESSSSLSLGSGTLAAKTIITSWNTFATAPTEKSSQTTAASYIQSLYNDVGNATPSAGSTSSLPAVDTTVTDSSGFAYFNKTDHNFAFGTGYATSDLDYNSDGSTSAPTSAVLDLYEVAQTSSGTAPGTLLGTFSLAGNGNLTYSPEAVPEPSSYALVGFGALVLVWNLRRRNHRGSTV